MNCPFSVNPKNATNYLIRQCSATEGLASIRGLTFQNACLLNDAREVRDRLSETMTTSPPVMPAGYEGRTPAAPRAQNRLLSKMPVRPGYARLALVSEGGESKLLW